MRFKLEIFFLNVFLLVFTPLQKVLAHEAYVMPAEDFWGGMNKPISLYSFEALQDPANLKIALLVLAGVILLYLLGLIFRLTPIGRFSHRSIEKLAPIGPFLVRAAIATSFFFSALTLSFLGPELPISMMPFAELIRWTLFALSFMIAFGFLTEIAGLIALILFTIAFLVFGLHTFSHLNYLGEVIVLFLFGMRSHSIDRKIFGPLGIFRKHWEKYETSIVRIFYGLSLIYAAVAVKLLHPDIPLKVINDWNLTQFGWLFPSDPLLIVLGAALVEIAIGIFIIIGFELRLTVLISLFYITLSLFFFKEMVWPHLMLYGISLALLVQPEVFTLDHLIFRHHRSFKEWWKRPFLPHTHVGKSIRHEESLKN